MIRLVTLDLYDTLAGAVPTRPERFAMACRDELGIAAEPAQFRRGYVIADDFYTVENGRAPLHLRDSDEVNRFYQEFTRLILADAGLPSDPVTGALIRTWLQTNPNRRETYPDVAPALRAFRERDLALAIVSNTPVDCTPLCEQLDLCSRVDFIVSSCLVGCEKPDPRIFHAALERAGVSPAEALHVGDQPLSDVVGALGVGMGALLIDRDGLRTAHRESPRIESLLEVLDYLDRPRA